MDISKHLLCALKSFVACHALLLPMVGAEPAWGGRVSHSGFPGGDDGFRTTVKQRYEFSCGAAALATLMIHHYEEPVAPEEIYLTMFMRGSQDRIKAKGFSMLDMKKYLEIRGYSAAGYQLNLDKVEAIGLPGVVLLTFDGDSHFVVVKGISREAVLIGDPVTGTSTLSREEFTAMWNGAILIVKEKPLVARRNFNRPEEWEAAASLLARTSSWRSSADF